MRWVIACLPVGAMAVASACGGGGSAPDDQGTIALPERDAAEQEDAKAPDATVPIDTGTDTGLVDAADAGPGCNGALDCERAVFVTKAMFVGAQLGGLAGADAKCQAAADALTAAPRVKGRKFQAWVSTVATSAGARLPHGTKAYVLPTTQPQVVATGWTDLVDGNLVNGIDIDETGAQVGNGGGNRAWTGTNNNATSSANTCGDWANTGANGQRGNVGGAGGGWTDIDMAGCQNQSRLYCFEL